MWPSVKGYVFESFFYHLLGYAQGTPFKMSCSPTTGAVPPYSSSPNPYPAAVYPVRSSYPQQNPYAQVRSINSSIMCVILQWTHVGANFFEMCRLHSSKALTTHSPCTPRHLTSFITLQWFSPMACQRLYTLLLSLLHAPMESPWEW